MKLNKQQTGVGLIEALVAALVFAFGIAALVQLQGSFFKNSSAANSRSMAMSIAQEKLEDLRGFQSTNTSDKDIFDFTTIGTNTGGRCTEQNDNDDCTVLLSSTGTNKGNTGFSRNWTVTNYYYSDGDPTTTVPAGATVPDQKKVTVNIAWTDTDGSNQTLALEGLINRNSGASIGSIANYAAGGSGQSPVVPYTPSTDTHVTPVGVGTDTKRETLVPSSQTIDGYSRTRFIAYTYSTGGGLVREEEFQNVACDCRFNGTSDDNNKTFTASHPIWDTAKDTYVDVDGDLVSGKVKGCVQGGGSNCDTNPEPLCDICCRDHHDTSSATFKFDPFRSSDDFTAGDHKHYNGINPVTSDQYLEACRLKRINGNWRVFEDWNLVKFTVLPLSDLIDSATKAIYTNYVKNVIDAHLAQSKVSGESLSSPPAKPPTLDHTVSGNYISLAAVGEKRELTARAVYLDFIDSTHLNKVLDKKNAVPQVDYLLHLPFYELEVAPVSDWQSADSEKIRVGPYNGPGSSDDLIAGKLTALANAASPVRVTGAIKKSNSGIAALNPAVDYNALTNPDSATQSDSVSVVCAGCTGAPSTDCTLPWGGTIASGTSTTAYEKATVPFGSSCVSETRTCSNGTLSGRFTNQTCSVAPFGTCTTTVTGKANNKDDTITLSVNGSPTSCTVASSKNYACSPVTTPLLTLITVTSAGTVNSTVTILPICGAKTVNF